jgi:hypothetical protein
MVDIVTSLQDAQSGFQSWQGQEIFLYSRTSSAAQGPTQPPTQRVPGLFPG